MATNHWLRQSIYYRNEFKQSAGQLIGLVTGLIADRVLNDAEISFLHEWMTVHDEVAHEWPGDILHARIKAVIEDGVITEEERSHLLATLDDLVGANPETLTSATHVTALAFDDVESVLFEGRCFCLTGNFVYAPRPVCEQHVVQRGGLVSTGVSKKVQYVVVGSLGSQEWKHGSYGTKVEKAMHLKHSGAPILVVKEDVWAAAL